MPTWNMIGKSYNREPADLPQTVPQPNHTTTAQHRFLNLTIWATTRNTKPTHHNCLSQTIDHTTSHQITLNQTVIFHPTHDHTGHINNQNTRNLPVRLCDSQTDPAPAAIFPMQQGQNICMFDLPQDCELDNNGVYTRPITKILYSINKQQKHNHTATASSLQNPTEDLPAKRNKTEQDPLDTPTDTYTHTTTTEDHPAQTPSHP